MRKSILILDDQQELLVIIEREFRKKDHFAVSTATSISDALRILAQTPINLVISDIRLGEESGFTFASILAQQYPSVGVILMSAYRSAANRQQAEALGAVKFLEKPFTIAKLIGVVDEYFTHKDEHFTQKSSTEMTKSTTRLPFSTGATRSLSHFKAQDLVQLFCLNGSAIMISVKEINGQKSGTIYIQRGQVLHAEMGDLAGVEAFHALMALPKSELAVNDWDRLVTQTIATPWEHLLLTSAVQNDHNNYGELSSQVG